MFFLPAPRWATLRYAAMLPFLCLLPSFCFGVETHVWEQSDPADYARGTLKHLSIRSDGHLTLSPKFEELDATTVPYLWALAQDSKGTVFYAGGAPTGATTKIFARSPKGKSRTVAEITGLEIHALAVDGEDQLYAAVLPDAKIYRIAKSGKPELFFDPHCKYIWAMTFDHSGNLFVATGEAGVIYKVTPDGKGSEFAHTEETHARSMIIDHEGNLIVGTEPGGLVMRISPAGKSFVLFQTRKREVTAVAEHDGFIYAAAVGTKPAAVSGPSPVLPQTPPPLNPSGTIRVGTTPPAPAPSIGSLNASVTGGSDLYRIQSDGFAERLWDSATDIAYAIAFDAAGKPLLATGNKGIIYRIDSDQLSTQLLNAPPTQVTAFLAGKDGLIYALTGNVGSLYAIGPGMESSGTFESEVLDAGQFSYWGKVHVTSSANGGTLGLEARSGNLNNPQHDWSSWTAVPVDRLGGAIQSPAARFLQYRLTLKAGDDGGSPDVSLVDVPYLAKNVAPKIQQIEIAPVNYREAPSTSLLERAQEPSGASLTISLPAIGQRRSGGQSPALETAGAATLQYNKGFITVRWSASDLNRDSLVYKLELRGKSETLWRLLKDNLQDTHYAFDSAAFADGEYVARVTVSDAPSNPPALALSSSMTSDPFTVDNTPPEIAALQTEKNGSQRKVSFTAKDGLSWIDKAEYSLNGGAWMLVQPTSRVSDSQVLHYELTVDAGQILALRVFDENDNVVVKTIGLD